MANGDSFVSVTGPDGKPYKFPQGTTKDIAVSYFKKKGIGAAPSKTPDVAPSQAAQPSVAAPQASQQFAPGTYQTHSGYIVNPTDTPEKSFTGSFLHAWGVDPDKTRAEKTDFGAVGEGLKEAGTSLAKGISQEWKQSDLPTKVLFPFHLGARFAEGVASNIENAAKDIETGDSKNIGAALGALLGTKSQVFEAKDVLEKTLPDQVKKGIAAHANVVDGGLKLADTLAKKTGVDPAQAASGASFLQKHPTLSSLAKGETLRQTYIDNKGLDVKGKLAISGKDLHSWINEMSLNLVGQIDKGVPSGVIDAGKEASDVQKMTSDIDKTGGKLPTTLAQILNDAKKSASVPPGQWTFGKALQLSSDIGRSIERLEGRNKAIASRAYEDLRGKLGTVAKQYKLGDTWDLYNKEAHTYYRYYHDTLNEISQASSGKGVLDLLKRDSAMSKRMFDNLSKYKLDSKEALLYLQRGTWADKQQPMFSGRSVMKYAYSAGFPAMLLGRSLGAGYAPSAVAGFALGVSASYLNRLIRTHALSGDMAWEMYNNETRLQGRQPLGKGVFPSEEGPTEPKSGGSSPTPTPLLPAAPLMAEGSTTQIAELPQTKVPENISTKAKAIQAKSERTQVQQHTEALKGTEPKVTKLSPEAGNRATKQRERVAKVRKEKGSTALGGGTQEISGGGVSEEIAKTQARVNSPHLDLTNLQIPEMEEALRAKSPKDFNMLQKFRRTKQVTDEEYQEGLRHFLIIAYEDNLKDKVD